MTRPRVVRCGISASDAWDLEDAAYDAWTSAIVARDKAAAAGNGREFARLRDEVKRLRVEAKRAESIRMKAERVAAMQSMQEELGL